MPQKLPRFGSDEIQRALDGFDPVNHLVEELVRSPDPLRSQRTTITPKSGTEEAGTEWLLLYDGDADVECLFDAAALGSLRCAALVAVAARQLLAPGVVTGGVLGSGFTAQLLLMLIAKRVPNLSHVAVFDTRWNKGLNAEPQVLDQLDLAGVGLSLAYTPEEALLGATLVVLTEPVVAPRHLEKLSRGALLVNATGQRLPDDLIARADQFYVDEAALLSAPPASGSGPVSPHLGGRGVDADLGRLLAGGHPGRQRFDDLLVIDLLGATIPSASLARAVRDRTSHLFP